MKQKILCVIVGVSCSVLLNNTNAQSKISIRCQFDTGNSAEYLGQDIRQKRQATGDLPPLTYDQINARENTARLITGTGTNDVYVMTGAIGSVHLMESTGYGNLNITTVFNISQITFKNSVPAVHSRHNTSPRGNSTNPIPSQYYGSCIALP